MTLIRLYSTDLEDGAVHEEADEEDEVEDGVVALLLDADDARRPERRVRRRAVVPREEAELEEVLHHHHRLQTSKVKMCYVPVYERASVKMYSYTYDTTCKMYSYNCVPRST